jgi:adenine phosphoribosyltransferase
MNILKNDEIEFLKNQIRDIKDFPKEGIVFKDITTLLNDHKAFNLVIESAYNFFKDKNIDFVAGIDSRGFIFGTPLALKLGVGFIPIRKKNKLPSETFSVTYDLEYGTDTLEIHKDAFLNKKSRVLLVDDLLATGGTAKASLDLIEKTGSKAVYSLFLINLLFLNGSSKLQNQTEVISFLDF